MTLPDPGPQRIKKILRTGFVAVVMTLLAGYEKYSSLSYVFATGGNLTIVRGLPDATCKVQ